MKNALYFCSYDSLNWKSVIEERCADLGLDLIYYRKLKDGHISKYREFKVRGNFLARWKFKTFINSNITTCKNPHILREKIKRGHLRREIKIGDDWYRVPEGYIQEETVFTQDLLNKFFTEKDKGKKEELRTKIEMKRKEFYEIVTGIRLPPQNLKFFLRNV